jgi:hypothetical protein
MRSFIFKTLIEASILAVSFYGTLFLCKAIN